VTALVRRGARPGQLAALDAAVQADVATGVPAALALDGRARELADVGRVTDGPLVAPLSPAPGGFGAAAEDLRGGFGPSAPGKPTNTNTGGTTPPPVRQPPRRP
jgi:hypothetical protein